MTGAEDCCLIPHAINTLFLNGRKNRGDMPLGVHLILLKLLLRGIRNTKRILLKIWQNSIRMFYHIRYMKQ